MSVYNEKCRGAYPVVSKHSQASILFTLPIDAFILCLLLQPSHIGIILRRRPTPHRTHPSASTNPLADLMLNQGTTSTQNNQHKSYFTILPLINMECKEWDDPVKAFKC